MSEPVKKEELEKLMKDIEFLLEENRGKCDFSSLLKLVWAAGDANLLAGIAGEAYRRKEIPEDLWKKVISIHERAWKELTETLRSCFK